MINCTYDNDSLPLSPYLPRCFPATEKSGHGGPPMNPTRLSPCLASVI